MTTPDSRAAQYASLQAALAGRWSIESELGRGGMGTVYLARDVALERPVAIKVLAPELAQDPIQRARFLREARIGARLTHPHIVPIYAVEEAAGSVYIVMGLVDGESLAERLHRSGPLGSEDARRVLREIGWALGYAHAMGTLHRDVTLDNILIDRRSGRAMLVDFGIASTTDRTNAEPLVGTPAYLAPELIQGEQASVRSDIYSLGICGWAALSGRLPYQSDDVGATLLQHLTAPIPSLADAAPGVSATLIRSVESCLAKSPGNRPHSMESWLLALEGTAVSVADAGPLAKWVDEWSHVKAFYAMAGLLGVLYSFEFSRSIFSTGAGMLFGRWRALFGLVAGLALAILPAYLVHRVVGLRMLRSAIRAGYGIEDLRLALAAKDRRGPHAAPGVASKVSQLAVAVMKRAGVVLLITLIAAWTSRPPANGTLPAILEWYIEMPFLVYFLPPYLGLAYQVLVAALTVHLLVNDQPNRLTRWLNQHRLAFWSSARGRFAFTIASLGLKKVAATPEQTLHRPTELMLDLAIDDLWRILPDSHQKRLAGLPSLARSLRERVAKLREIQYQVDTSGIGNHPELLSIRQELTARQAAGVTALERLRLLLMKLGDATITEAEMTRPVELARGAAQDLLATLGAHQDIHRRLRQVITPLTAVATPV